MISASKNRDFLVHARHVDRHHARRVSETSFEAAAIAYLEHLPHAPDATSEIGVIVRDLETGHEHSFRVDLETGDAAPTD